MKPLMPKYYGKPMFWVVDYAIWEYRDRMKWKEVRRRRLAIAWIVWNILSIVISLSLGTHWLGL